VSQVSLHNDAYNPAVKMKFTLPEPVPHGGVTTGSVLYIHPDGLMRRRFAAASNAALSSLTSADRGQLDVFTTVTCGLRRASCWSVSARARVHGSFGASVVAVSYTHLTRE
jgi:hypothetical protein